jgi:hypothetical protein
MKGGKLTRRAILFASIVAIGVCPSSGRTQASPTFAFDGQLRLRSEWDGRAVGTGDDAATLSRIRVGARATLGDWLRVYVQVQDARAWGTEANTLTDASADFFDMHQGFAELGTDALRVRLGRQEVALGDQRLIGSVGWSNTGRAFDGGRLLGETSGVGWTVFWMNVAERDLLLPVGLQPQGNQGVSDDGWLIGGFVSGKIGSATAELTAVVDKDAVTDESYTVNLRAHGRTGSMMYEAAGAYQFGPDRSAFFASGKVGAAVGRGTIAAQLDYLSGDDDLTDSDIKAFNTLYATNHKFYGIMDYVLNPPGQLDQAGLVDAIVRGSVTLPGNKSARVDLHRFWMAVERSGEQALGTELDVIGNWSFHTYAGLQLGGGVFLPEPLATQLLPAFGLGDDPTYWGFVQLTLFWP